MWFKTAYKSLSTSGSFAPRVHSVACTESSTPSIVANRDIAQARRHAAIRITDEIAIHQTEIEERFVRASGPGGQHVNKVSTAASTLPDPLCRRTSSSGLRRWPAAG